MENSIDVGGAAPILGVRSLGVTFRSRNGQIDVVNELSYDVWSGRTLAIIGESGSGKTVGARAVMGLLPPGAAVRGSIRFAGKEVAFAAGQARPFRRGLDIAMVLQDASRALNPTLRVGFQIAEVLRQHMRLDWWEANQRAKDLLDLMKVPAAQHRFNSYPHELSGGQRQRVLMAIAVAANPKVLIADEATRSLDPLIECQIVEQLRELQRQNGMALIIITHDISLASKLADDVLVMYAGRVVEHAGKQELMERPRMRYTKALLDAVPRLRHSRETTSAIVPGEYPDIAALPSGCSFRPRCAWSTNECEKSIPELKEHSTGHWWACVNPCMYSQPE